MNANFEAFNDCV